MIILNVLTVFLSIVIITSLLTAGVVLSNGSLSIGIFLVILGIILFAITLGVISTVGL